MTAANVLFPIPHAQIVSGFTTAPAVSLAHVAHVALSDSNLGVHKVSRHSHDVVVPPYADSAHPAAWEAVFAQGSINPGNKTAPPGGFGFYMHGPETWRHELERCGGRQEVVMSYEVLFEDGWEWQRGGKLPGIYGGIGAFAYGCSGGRQESRCKCFDLRLMWRQGGKSELYAYIPLNDTNTAALLNVPQSHRNPDYGFSVGRGLWTFAPGHWTVVAERVRMNTVGHADGEIEVFIDGQSVLHATGLILRDTDAAESSVQGLHFQTFFGGSSEEWACPKDQKAWFTNVSGAILRAEPAHDEL
ncbi:polysaccharide lyase family 14 protein [Phanerochaete carnosa HHB-10118-sp]|uniref:Polysaccharide lyase family 14 protein n=1 Tax=Phanerochaete carnosa (strain HHB-10118-sp) TaxID=650164 RepID=K5VQT4_PHACS|nr:polysaccharide lyase family 14 protein [Phanerochaete carnosa HHB-10118-sp]EKM53798.1 polysaccharide lyase family 14 protein [Phanerochaete carnosa HHB-10118-sp]